MSYPLSQAIADLKASQLNFTQRQFRVALEGDPLGTIYHVAAFPISMTDGMTVYTSSASLSSASYTIDYDSGAILLTSGSINSPLTATYTAQEFSDTTLYALMGRAMDYLELAWPRGFAWSSSASSGVVSMYSGGVLVPAIVPGPPGGDFGLSRSEVELLLLAGQVGLTEARLSDAAAHFFMFRGGMGGIQIDKSNMARHLDREAERLQKRFMFALAKQQDYWNATGGSPGGWVGNPWSQDYEANFEWQSVNRGRLRPPTGVE